MGAFTHDVIILGHGLAGAVFTHVADSRGLKVHVIDAPRPGRASHVAAGIINPVSLRRDVLTWRAFDMIASAGTLYADMEREMGRRIWHPMRLIKIFPNVASSEQWQRAMSQEAGVILSSGSDKELERNNVPAPHGHGTVHDCAWLDIRLMLELHREWLLKREMLTQELVVPASIVDVPDGVAIGGVSAPMIVHCDGPFAKVPGMIPVKGEVLTVKIPGLSISGILHRKVFLLPLGGDRFRLGSTYAWNDVWSGPDEAAVVDLLGRLKEMLPGHEVEVVEHLAGVRPAAKDRRPILGWLRSRHAVFNGLGSRGGMLAPWCAGHLAAHLFEGTPLDPEVDLQRFSAEHAAAAHDT